MHRSLLASLSSNSALLRGILRGIEKEGLRVDDAGRLALTPHPRILGSALTHPRITTDYSESLLELITGTRATVAGVLEELRDVHCFVARHLDGELLWNQSMPALLPAEEDIPIAWYGTSNTGMLKHVYRRGLAVRGGRTMQCIAGLHYNFSLPEALWDLSENAGDVGDAADMGITDGTRTGATARKSSGYMALIRNFTRHAWLLMYLFGASPAVSGNFLRQPGHDLLPLTEDTWHLPYATSLRMSDLGYHNQAQSELQLCYNDLDTFLRRMYKAVTTPWPAYQAIGTQRDGEWIQLNTNILQIENEYYSNIRPKHPVGRCERPLTVLAQKGIQYVEVRCLDIDPFSPVGISPETCRFLDAFLLFCAVEKSPRFDVDGFCQHSHHNFNLVAKQGRQPGLHLTRNGQSVSLQAWAAELLDRMSDYAALLGDAYDDAHYTAAINAQRDKVHDASLTPSARLLRELRDTGASLHQVSLQSSRAHHDALRGQTLSVDAQARLRAQAEESLRQQQMLERSDTVDFATYVRNYEAALQSPHHSSTTNSTPSAT